jgi:hypothetical protein
MLSSIEERVLALPNRQFERALGDIVIERRAGLFQTLRQCGPMLQQIRNCFP